MNETAHYHVTINHETLSWAHVTQTEAEADEIASTEAMAISADVAVTPCHDQQCGEYLDLLAHEEFTRGLARSIRDLDREHVRAMIESDGHGPLE